MISGCEINNAEEVSREVHRSFVNRIIEKCMLVGNIISAVSVSSTWLLPLEIICDLHKFVLHWLS